MRSALAVVLLLASCAPTTEDRVIQAVVDQIRERLLAPSQATFGDLRATVNGERWEVMGWCDAPNRFGAMLRKQVFADGWVTGSSIEVINARLVE